MKALPIGYDKLQGIIFFRRETWVRDALSDYERHNYCEEAVHAAERLAWILRKDFNVRNGLEDDDGE